MPASRTSKQVTDSRAEIQDLVRQVEGLRAELNVIAARMGCLRDQLQYWMALLDMPDNAAR